MPAMLQRIIKFVDQFFQTDSVYLIRGGFWLGAGKAAGTLILLLLSVLYARYLTKDLYGEFRYVLSVMGMFSILSFPGLATSMMRSVARGYEGAYRKTAWHMFVISFGMTAIGLGFGVFYYFFEQNIPLAFSFIAAALLIPFVEGLGNWRAYFDGKKEFQKKTTHTVLSHIFYGLIMMSAIAIITYTHPPLNLALVILVGASYVGHGLPNILYSIELLRKIPRNLPMEPGSLQYGYRLTSLDIIPNIAYNLDTVLLFNFLGPSALAVYAFALAPVQQIRTMFDIVPLIAFPKIAMKTKDAKSTHELTYAVRKKIARTLPFTFLIALFYILMAPVLYAYLFPTYMSSVLPSQILALSLIFFPLNISNTALKAEGDMKKLFMISTGIPIGKIIALVILIPLYGLWGAVIVNVAGLIFGYTLAYFLFQKNSARV